MRLLIVVFFLLITTTKAQVPSASNQGRPPMLSFFTHIQATGNSYLAGRGTFPNIDRVTTPLANPVDWLVLATDIGFDPLAIVTNGASGANIYHLTAQNTLVLEDTSWLEITESQPFALYVLPPVLAGVATWGGREWNYFNGSHLTHLIGLDEYLSEVLVVSETGNLVLMRNGRVIHELPLNVIPDARLVRNADGLIAVYVNATNQRYVHGVLGDDIEGASLAIVRAHEDHLEIVSRVDLEGDAVFEGLYPIWADVNQDGVEDLITTVSDSNSGSRIRVYQFDGQSLVAIDGVPIGRGGRWQHALAWAPFGVDGTFSLVEVKTPHIGGVVRFYEYRGDQMTIVAELTGYTSHVLGSRNLNMAVAGDFNGDQIPEIVLPSQDRTRIAGIQRTQTGAEVVWELPINGILKSNLSAVTLPDSRLALAFATEDNQLNVWIPRGE